MLECDPPDKPVWGGYGPVKEYYKPGDVIHYFCDIDTYIGGDFYRKCLDTGDWSGGTPMCDAPTSYRSTSQTSTFDEESDSEKAVDGVRTTCSETIGGEREEWSGTFDKPGQLLRVMLLLPKGPASFEIILVKQNGDEIVCGKHTRDIDRYDFIIQNCPDSNNMGAAGLKVRSLSTHPLKICELQAYVLTSPKCPDPSYPIKNGHLELTRHKATLVCNSRYTRGPDVRLECVREGEWNRKTLLCIENEWGGVASREPFVSRGPRGPDNQPNRKLERERLRSF